MAVRMVASALLVAVLAGCASKGGATTDDPVEGVDVKATATTGVIRGLVVDMAIRPVAGMAIRATPGERATQTNANGAFGFEGLEPGTYFITAQKPGYESVQQSVEVVAGVDEPAPVRIQVAQLPNSKPYHDVVKFRGHQAFGVSGHIPPTGVLSERPRFVSGIPLLFNGSFSSTYEYAPNPTWQQTIVDWTPTNPSATQLLVDECVYVAGGECDDEGEAYSSQTIGTAPIVISADAAFQSALVGNGSLVDEVVVWAAGTLGTMPDAGLTFNQDFTVITVHTYNYVPPAGYRFDRDGAPVDPK